MDGCITCRICGAPVPRGTGNTPRELHEPCKGFINWLDAAARELRKIVWYETPSGRAARKRARGKFFALANEMPVDYYNLRDSRGRFSPRRE